MSDEIIVFSDSNFEEKVEKETLPTLVDFWAEWCGPCRALAPTIKDLSVEYKDKVQIGKLNVDENPKVAGKYGIRGIPTLLLFKDGKVQQQLVGVKPKDEIKGILDKYI